MAIETESERRARERANLVAALERSGGKVYGSGGAGHGSVVVVERRAKPVVQSTTFIVAQLRGRRHDMIVDDDGKGEAADIVAIRLVGDRGASRTEVEETFQLLLDVIGSS